MKYKTEIEIDAPRDHVVSIFTDPSHAFQWQEGLQGRDHLQGEENKPGAKTRIKYRIGKDDLEMEEEILTSDLPGSISYLFRVRDVENTCINSFQELESSRTRWIQVNEFHFHGFMKLMGFFAPGAFRKQTEADMKRFKEYVESMDSKS